MTTNYVHTDHLGSMDVFTDEWGNVKERLSFDAFGERRSALGWQDSLTSGVLESISAVTKRGYTGHGHIDHADIIHMNGRIYDSKLGRFVQADPVIQEVKNSQNYNRYSYVLNNPLSYTDPTGLMFEGFCSMQIQCSAWEPSNQSEDPGSKSSSKKNEVKSDVKKDGFKGKTDDKKLDSSAGKGKSTNGASYYSGKDLKITNEEQQFLKDGDLGSFWNSRIGKDPVARIGLMLWGSKEQIDNAFKNLGDDYWHFPREYWDMVGTNVRQTLTRAFGSTGQLYGKSSEEYLGMMRKVGLDVARQHSLEVMDDYNNNRGQVRGLLDLDQMAKYHHRAFRLNGLRDSDYGGTMFRFIPDKIEYFFTGDSYCPDCDSDHRVRN